MRLCKRRNKLVAMIEANAGGIPLPARDLECRNITTGSVLPPHKHRRERAAFQRETKDFPALTTKRRMIPISSLVAWRTSVFSQFLIQYLTSRVTLTPAETKLLEIKYQSREGKGRRQLSRTIPLDRDHNTEDEPRQENAILVVDHAKPS